MLVLAYVAEIVHVLCRSMGLPAPGPFLTVTEVYKVAVTHYFSSEPAKRELGYSPIVRGRTARRRLVRAWQQRLAASGESGSGNRGEGQQWSARLRVHAARVAVVLMRTMAVLLVATRMMLLLAL
jgi:hypothetical protein